MPNNALCLQTILQQQGLISTSTEPASLSYLIRENILTSQQIATACATYFSLEDVYLTKEMVDFSLCHSITHPLFLQYTFLPLKKNECELTIAISDPEYLFLATELKFQLNLNIKIVFVRYEQLISFLNPIISQHYYSLANENSIIDLSHQLLTDAVYRQASDIHCEVTASAYRIRMRMDGLLYEIAQLPVHLAPAISSRFKIMADLDIAEKRLPQDGRFTFTTSHQIMRDCRLSTCPTVFGEKIVIRLLNPHRNSLPIETLGMTEKQQQLLLTALQQPQGLILVTGPTGSGKTLTLYTALNYLNCVEKNISTIEDPVEIYLPGINQVNINNKAGLHFAAALRAFLRQDPDIIMIGEIRDLETASMAIRAAHTGHLVLSTLHTNSAAEAVTRLLDMGIEPFNIASTVTLIIAQRLIRLRCPLCEGQSCESCMQGYKGRSGIFEMLPIDQTARELILAKAPATTLASTSEKHGIQNLWQMGLNKAHCGLTTLAEIHRVLPS